MGDSCGHDDEEYGLYGTHWVWVNDDGTDMSAKQATKESTFKYLPYEEQLHIMKLAEKEEYGNK